MNNAIWLVSLSLCVVLATACGGSPEPSPSAAPEASASAAAPASGDSIGVPECDEYLAKVEACIDEHVPDEAKAIQQQTMDQMRSQWRQAASNDAAKSGLATGCKAALDAAKASMSAYGCEW